MAGHILFVHGAGGTAYDEDEPMVESLRRALGEDYRVTYPTMPDPDNPTYTGWQAAIAEHLAALDGPVVIVGHSFGASMALKYLTEATPPQPIAGLFMIATPYWGAEDWEVEEYALSADWAAHLPPMPVFLYHSHDDDIVPFEHMHMYAQELPRASVREVHGRGHQFNDDLREVAADILSLVKQA